MKPTWTATLAAMDERKEHRRRLQRVGLYTVGKAIGRGNFATVYLATHQIAKTKVALKYVDKAAVEPENLVKLEREITIMKSLDHPHIIKLYEVMRTQQNIYIVTEYCRGGEMFEALVERGRIGEDEAKKWFHQTCSAVSYCHERGIVHRDLKAENILLDKNGDIKIIDFGFANYQKPQQLLNTWCGSPPYAAPELLLGNDYDGTKADVWSLGVLLYILVCGGFPFPGESIDKLKRAVLSGQVKIPFWVSVECSDLLRKMLVPNPDHRYTIGKVLSHRWLSGSGVTKTNPVKDNLLANAALLGERKAPRLNPTVLCFMQQHGKWNEETIIEEVLRKNYDNSVFPTYEILCDKLKSRKVEENGDAPDHPRRGSRGSILSGKVNVEPEPHNMIPTADLAQLSLSTDEENESDDSSASDMCEEAPGTSFRRRRRRQLRNVVPFDEVNSGGRRHTCASEQLLNPILAHLPYQLNAIAIQQAQLAALAQAQLLQQFMNANQQQVQPLDFARMLPVPNYERRASASDSLFQGALLSGLQQAAQLNLPSTSKATTPTIEEEGHRYLTQRGGKRNTVHAVGSPLFGSPSPTVRHLKSPYQKTVNGERRSSWASSTVTAQQQAQLEKLYKKSLLSAGGGGGGSDSLHMIKQLQLEFQQLGRMTQGCSNSSSHSPQQRMDSSSLSLKCTPRISITDENNRSLQPAIQCNSANFDPLNQFMESAHEIVYGQRPATAIGFSQVSNGFPGSNASSPERPMRPDSSTKVVLISQPPASVLEHLKSALVEEQIVFHERSQPIEPEKGFPDKEVRCLSIANTVEIGVASVTPDESKSHVEFCCFNDDTLASETLCNVLIQKLRALECAAAIAAEQ